MARFKSMALTNFHFSYLNCDLIDLINRLDYLIYSEHYKTFQLSTIKSNQFSKFRLHEKNLLFTLKPKSILRSDSDS